MAERAWSVAEAKGRLSELLHEVDQSGPQIITRRGEQVAVVVSLDEWRRKTTRTGSLADFFARSPLAGSRLDVTRDRTQPREVAL
ncbi:MAG: type II toxin-antitoxin system Phd/YefM family antitoxin [Natronosporangium sp.]